MAAVKRESGVLLPIVAVSIATIIFIGVVFVIDTKRVREGRALAEMHGEQLCALSAQALPSQQGAAARAAAFLSNLDADPNTSAIDLSSYVTLSSVRIVSPTAYEDLATPTPFVSAPVSLACGGACQFDGRAATAGYPTGFWSDANFNGYISCEVETQINTLVSTTRSAKTKTAYRLRVIGAKQPNTQPRGIIFGIAPHAEIDDTDNRFQFSAGFNSTFPGYDPLDPSATIDAFTNIRKQQQGVLGAGPGEKLASSNSIANPSERAQMLRHAYGPFHAVRNTLLQSLTARFARLWETRDRMQAMILGTAGGSDANASAPKMIVEFGQDATLPEYELPYHYHNKGSGSVVCPYQSCSAANEDIFLAQQLRDTFFVNVQTNGIATLQDFSFTNVGYEPPALASAQFLAPDYPASEQFWGFTDPSQLQNLETLMRILPVVELCPTVAAGCAKNASPETDPNAYPTGLRPDITAFLDYINGTLGAYPLPGYLPPPAVPAAPKLNPESASTFPANQRSPIVLVLSRRIFDLTLTGEADAIRNSLPPNQPITVIYIPTDKAAADVESIRALEWAFGVDSSSTNPINRVFRVMPRSCDLSTANCWRGYWESLLQPGAGNIEEIAANIFDHLTTLEVTL